MSVGDIALAELGLQQPDLQLNDLLADLGFDKSVAWWFFINPDEDSPVRILFLYYREF
ncbi:hypothetical protein X907_2354 [Glycocaulis alkaliphilus]|uniref:Uncharacterized protein n=2 Tax=Maricaulaceae TaxID=2800061 RepID=A0A3T0EC45_9PROT|nr:hypothetical protein X907_2354 [Glycocaulis alkaliphilus]